MAKLHLLGELGKRYGRYHCFAIHTPAEAIRALSANFVDFEAFIQKSELAYRLIVGKQSLHCQDELHYPSGQQIIKIVPVVHGAGGEGGQLFAGAVLMAAAFAVPGLGTTILFGKTTLAMVSFSVGLSLTLGGIAQLLAPQPEADEPNERPENQPSYHFNGAVNTTAQGHPVPLGYGRLRVGSAVISAGLDVAQLV